MVFSRATNQHVILLNCIGLMLIAGLLFGMFGSWFSLRRSLGKAASA
jgi:hypothetical protein